MFDSYMYITHISFTSLLSFWFMIVSCCQNRCDTYLLNNIPSCLILLRLRFVQSSAVSFHGNDAQWKYLDIEIENQWTITLHEPKIYFWYRFQTFLSSEFTANIQLVQIYDLSHFQNATTDNSVENVVFGRGLKQQLFKQNGTAEHTDKSKTRLFSLLYFCHFIDTVVRTSVGGWKRCVRISKSLYFCSWRSFAEHQSDHW